MKGPGSEGFTPWPVRLRAPLVRLSNASPEGERGTPRVPVHMGNFQRLGRAIPEKKNQKWISMRLRAANDVKHRQPRGGCVASNISHLNDPENQLGGRVLASRGAHYQIMRDNHQVLQQMSPTDHYIPRRYFAQRLKLNCKAIVRLCDRRGS